MVWVWGFRGVGFMLLGFRVLGFRVLGVMGLEFWAFSLRVRLVQIFRVQDSLWVAFLGSFEGFIGGLRRRF